MPLPYLGLGTFFFCNFSAPVGVCPLPLTLCFAPTKNRQKNQNSTKGIVYDQENVYVGEITKAGNFLKFEFIEFGSEREHISFPVENDKQELVRQASELERQGKTQREIANIMSLSLGKVNGLLKTAKEFNTFSADYVQPVHPLFDMEGVNIVNKNNDDDDSQNMKLPE